jgi:hypothetical protein
LKSRLTDAGEEGRQGGRDHTAITRLPNSPETHSYECPTLTGERKRRRRRIQMKEGEEDEEEEVEEEGDGGEGEEEGEEGKEEGE